MELREFALGVLEAPTLAGKLAAPPRDLTDYDPGDELRLPEPVRPAELVIETSRRVKTPPVAGMGDVSQRRRILHAMANHELQAAELFAWALLAFPDAPRAFRLGLLGILVDEQKHCRLYIERLEALGGHFGDTPVTGHFWNQLDDLHTPLEFVCVMGLTFENANLDFAGEYATAAREVGDDETAAVLDIVHRDEIRHVRFGWHWLQHFKAPDATAWDAYNDHVHFPLGPWRARGKVFDRESREAAGIDDSFIEQLERVEALRPNGRRR